MSESYQVTKVWNAESVPDGPDTEWNDVAHAFFNGTQLNEADSSNGYPYAYHTFEYHPSEKSDFEGLLKCELNDEYVEVRRHKCNKVHVARPEAPLSLILELDRPLVYPNKFHDIFHEWVTQSFPAFDWHKEFKYSIGLEVDTNLDAVVYMDLISVCHDKELTIIPVRMDVDHCFRNDENIPSTIYVEIGKKQFVHNISANDPDFFNELYQIIGSELH